MSLLQQIKRAALDNNAYRGPTDNDNWGTAEVNAWSYLCDRFGGHFNPEPRIVGQNPAFLEFLDKYKVEEYNKPKLETPPAGIDVRRLIPEAEPVNTEGLTRQEAALKREVINGNANVKVPDDMKPDEVVKTSTVQRKPILKETSANESPEGNKTTGNSDAVKSSRETSNPPETGRTTEVGGPTGNTGSVTEKSGIEEKVIRSPEVTVQVGDKPADRTVQTVTPQVKQPITFKGSNRPVRVR